MASCSSSDHARLRAASTMAACESGYPSPAQNAHSAAAARPSTSATRNREWCHQERVDASVNRLRYSRQSVSGRFKTMSNQPFSRCERAAVRMAQARNVASVSSADLVRMCIPPPFPRGEGVSAAIDTESVQPTAQYSHAPLTRGGAARRARRCDLQEGTRGTALARALLRHAPEHEHVRVGAIADARRGRGAGGAPRASGPPLVRSLERDVEVDEGAAGRPRQVGGRLELAALVQLQALQGGGRFAASDAGEAQAHACAKSTGPVARPVLVTGRIAVGADEVLGILHWMRAH